jgi:hypothetical protein
VKQIAGSVALAGQTVQGAAGALEARVRSVASGSVAHALPSLASRFTGAVLVGANSRGPAPPASVAATAEHSTAAGARLPPTVGVRPTAGALAPLTAPVRAVARIASGLTSFMRALATAAPATFTTVRTAHVAESGSTPGRLPRPPSPDDQSSSPLGSAGGTGGAGGAIFAALLLGFLLVTPNAGRWLRSVLALGLSPAYVAPGERPG